MDAEVLDEPRARMLSDWTTGLNSVAARAVCTELLPRAPGLSTGQLIEQIKKLAVALDPDWARRRYKVRPTGIPTRTAGCRAVVELAVPVTTLRTLGDQRGELGAWAHVVADLLHQLAEALLIRTATATGAPWEPGYAATCKPATGLAS